jgi:hypothetical protein
MCTDIELVVDCMGKGVESVALQPECMPYLLTIEALQVCSDRHYQGRGAEFFQSHAISHPNLVYRVSSLSL